LHILLKYGYQSWVETMIDNTILPQDAISNATEKETATIHHGVDLFVGQADQST
jgi:hypothetical protein